MAGARQSGQNQIFIPADVDTVFRACEKAASSVGNVKQSNPRFHSISLRTGMKMFPPQNPVNLRISVIPEGSGCNIRCDGDSFDGTVGFGSVGKAIDNFMMP